MKIGYVLGENRKRKSEKHLVRSVRKRRSFGRKRERDQEQGD